MTKPLRHRDVRMTEAEQRPAATYSRTVGRHNLSRVRSRLRDDIEHDADLLRPPGLNYSHTRDESMALNDELLARVDAHLPDLVGAGKVGILGGSFNPPHVGHALLAHAMLSTEDLDELWIIPVWQHPFGKDSVSFEHRMDMCRLAFSLLGNRVRILDIESVLPTPSYTVQPLSAIHAVRPGIKPTLIIASDISEISQAAWATEFPRSWA